MVALVKLAEVTRDGAYLEPQSGALVDTNSDEWEKQLYDLCRLYEIPIQNIAQIILDPKVLPMIRGKAFEYSVADRLRITLPATVWSVSQPRMNAQSGQHDVDLKVVHLPTNRHISIECKMSDKGSFRIGNGKSASARVKCMRSRTLGSAKVIQRSAELGIAENKLSAHSDSYTDSEFDFVASSLSNAFYDTDKTTLNYFWHASAEEQLSISNIAKNHFAEPKQISSEFIFLAKAKDLTPLRSGVPCTRKKCPDKLKCQFIPNFPYVNFQNATYTIQNPWFEVSEIERRFSEFLSL